jgi:hypothetical protein
MTDPITAMTQEAADAETRLRAAVHAAPCAPVLRAALGWYLTWNGRQTEGRAHIDAARAARAGLPRRDRHTVDILAAAVQQSATRATGLAAEHLREFPDDQLVRYVTARLDADSKLREGRGTGTAAP